VEPFKAKRKEIPQVFLVVELGAACRRWSWGKVPEKLRRYPAATERAAQHGTAQHSTAKHQHVELTRRKEKVVPG
jgi:hypothetical protein